MDDRSYSETINIFSDILSEVAPGQRLADMVKARGQRSVHAALKDIVTSRMSTTAKADLSGQTRSSSKEHRGAIHFTEREQKLVEHMTLIAHMEAAKVRDEVVEGIANLRARHDKLFKTVFEQESEIRRLKREITESKRTHGER